MQSKVVRLECVHRGNGSFHDSQRAGSKPWEHE